LSDAPDTSNPTHSPAHIYTLIVPQAAYSNYKFEWLLI
jgi:hypothetical protein